MPTYQYTCTECSQSLEAVQSFSDPALTDCPACQGRLRKVFNSVGVVFKGSGFYRTDSRAGNGGTDSTKSDAKSDGTSESKTAAKTDSSSNGSSGSSTSGAGATGGSSSNGSSNGAAKTGATSGSSAAATS